MMNDPCITPGMVIPSFIDGRMVDLYTLDPTDYDVESCAKTLSHLNRFNGRTDFPYSVAQHACLVAHLCPGFLKFRGLHHDDDEAFTGDIIGPIKDLFPGIREFVREYVRPPIDCALGLDAEDEHYLIKQCDIQALRLEQLYIQGRQEFMDVPCPRGARALLRQMSPKQACDLYLFCHRQYGGEDWRK